MKRHELTDKQWELIEPILSKWKATTGRKPRDPYQMLNEILWILRIGAPWLDLPKRFGTWQSFCDYYRNLRNKRTFDRIRQQIPLGY